MNKYVKRIVLLIATVGVLYGAGRLYFAITDGFNIDHINSNFVYDARWDTRPLSSKEKEHIDTILSQPFSYLGKGCQAYVFLSQDGNYVLKFFKYQRFRVNSWIYLFAFLPHIENFIQRKEAIKTFKLENVFRSWVVAFDELQPETGLLYVHLNKTNDINKRLTFYDKMGLRHAVDLDNMEFLIQRKATPLCAYIESLMKNNESEKAKVLISDIIALVLSEYRRGLADNDHALMQNTGVLDGKPIHIDVGQFVRNENARNPAMYKQELFSKTFKFNLWLKEHYPELSDYLQTQLRLVIGEGMDNMKPIFKVHNLD